MSVHQDCGAEIRWARRADDPSKWMPPLQFVGQYFVFGEDDAAIRMNCYESHRCDPDAMEAWQIYKARLAELQANQPSVVQGMTNWEIRREQQRDQTWEDALTRACPKCEAEIGVKCHRLDQRFHKTGEMVECKNPHPERLET